MPGRVIPESVDYVCFPIGGPVFQVGRVQRGFPIRVIGIPVMKVRKHVQCRKGWNGLWNKSGGAPLILGQKRLDLIGGVLPGSEGGFHHQSRLFEDLVFGILPQKVLGQENLQSHAGTKHQNEDQVKARE
jgi:hypothetical protein